MTQKSHEDPAEHARHMANITGTEYAIFDYALHGFCAGGPHFCDECELAAAGSCEMLSTHSYGCFEAERWNGLYIYYCPAGFVFISTLIYQEDEAACAMVGGPFIMGLPDDVTSELPEAMAEKLAGRRSFSPDELTSISRIQWSDSMFLSGRAVLRTKQLESTRERILYSLDEGGMGLDRQERSYPIETERRLQTMISHADKSGARELLNEYLGSIYFGTGGDFDMLRARAIEFAVLLSRALAVSGTDVRMAFGEGQDVIARMGRSSTTEELSGVLAALVHRFVGYAFNFDRVKHTDILHKVTEYVSLNYMRKISLEDVAAQVGLSRSYLSRIFKEEMRQGLAEFVNSIRIEKSKELLLDQSYSLVEVAAAAGFEDQSYYTKVFKLKVGITPGAFRRSGGAVVK